MKPIRMLFSLCALALCANLSSAQAGEKTKEALQASFQARYAKLAALKASGAVGETAEGYIAAVAGSPAPEAETLIREENADRAALYTLMAAELGVTTEEVARRNALRNFKNAEPGAYLRDEKGVWRIRKKAEE